MTVLRCVTCAAPLVRVRSARGGSELVCLTCDDEGGPAAGRVA